MTTLPQVGIAILFLVFISAPVSTVVAQDAPPSYVVSPDIYQVIAENDRMRMIMATWKPGQRDQFHSHPAVAAYFLTDCELRSYTPDGKFSASRPRTAGTAGVQGAISSHSAENVGRSTCQAVFTELK